jgi:hypothetical protein
VGDQKVIAEHFENLTLTVAASFNQHAEGRLVLLRLFERWCQQREEVVQFNVGHVPVTRESAKRGQRSPFVEHSQGPLVVGCELVKHGDGDEATELARRGGSPHQWKSRVESKHAQSVPSNRSTRRDASTFVLFFGWRVASKQIIKRPIHVIPNRCVATRCGDNAIDERHRIVNVLARRH